MIRTYSGSVLVPLLLLLSAAIIASMTIWKSSCLLADTLQAHEIYYQQHYATEGLLLCGCVIAAYNKEQIVNNLTTPTTLTFSHWPITDTKRGSGTITITAKTATEIVISACVRVDNHAVCVRRCMLQVPQGKGDTHERLPAIISDWSTESA